jgi:aminoglycoside phosphotransferase (APT) family kinase protein
MDALDLTTEAGITGYLQLKSKAGNFPAFLAHVSSVSKVSGGTGNFTFRVHLSGPAPSPSSVILKHSTGYVASIPAMAFDIDRWGFERKALEVLPSLAPVHLPEIFAADDENHVLIMADLNDGSEKGQHSVSTLKELILAEEKLEEKLATEIAVLLAQFMKQLHQFGGDDANKKDFENPTARQMCVFRTWTRLLPALKEAKAVPANHEQIVDEICQLKAADIGTNKTTIVMGDFWPGNILVRLTGDRKLDKIFIVDWELAHLGDPASDLGQFLAEVEIAGEFSKNNEVAAKAILSQFVDEYRSDMSDIEKRRIGKRTMVYTGAHEVTWIRAARWTSDEELVRKYCKRGAISMMIGSGRYGTQRESEIPPSLMFRPL